MQRLEVFTFIEKEVNYRRVLAHDLYLTVFKLYIKLINIIIIVIKSLNVSLNDWSAVMYKEVNFTCYYFLFTFLLNSLIDTSMTSYSSPKELYNVEIYNNNNLNRQLAHLIGDCVVCSTGALQGRVLALFLFTPATATY